VCDTVAVAAAFSRVTLSCRFERKMSPFLGLECRSRSLPARWIEIHVNRHILGTSISTGVSGQKAALFLVAKQRVFGHVSAPFGGTPACDDLLQLEAS